MFLAKTARDRMGGTAVRQPHRLLCLRSARVVRGIHVFARPWAGTVELKDGLASGRGEMCHPCRPVAISAGGHGLHRLRVELLAHADVKVPAITVIRSTLGWVCGGTRDPSGTFTRKTKGPSYEPSKLGVKWTVSGSRDSQTSPSFPFRVAGHRCHGLEEASLLRQPSGPRCTR
jgi:hypothetical protein